MINEDEKYIKVFSHKTRRKQTAWGTGCRWKYGIKNDLKELG
jgi:hypothetical protein